MKMLWLANSPNLNIIKKAWFYMKKEITKRGLTTNRKKLKARWEKCWQDLPQSKIQEWIEAIPHYVKEIIRLEGGNKYKGRKKGEEKITIY
jgi:trehalose-6-phosphate synthase